MGTETDISQLRARVTLLVEQEAALVQQALTLKRAGAERREVDALMNQVSAIQSERVSVKQEISRLLGAKRMYSADEVWTAGVYEYYRQAGVDPVRVLVTKGAAGLQVAVPGAPKPVRIDGMIGFFEGPIPS